MAVDIQCNRQGDAATITVNGTVDEAGAERLKETFTSLPLDQVKRVVIDCAGMRQIGSSGIGKILLFYKNLGLNDGKLEVVNLAEHLVELFHELKLDTLFTVRGR